MNNKNIKAALNRKEDMIQHLLFQITDPDGIQQLISSCLVYESQKRPNYDVILHKLEVIEKVVQSNDQWKEEQNIMQQAENGSYNEDD
jgi:hypothetical protein